VGLLKKKRAVVLDEKGQEKEWPDFQLLRHGRKDTHCSHNKEEEKKGSVSE